MTDETPSPDSDLPEPTNPEFIQMMAILGERVEESRQAKTAALGSLSDQASDEEILRDFGLDMTVLREDPF